MRHFGMSDDPLAYLLDRFATDATTLRGRATHLTGKPAPPHGPDAAASRRMAEACDHVLQQLRPLAGLPMPALLEGLAQLGPELESRAARAPDAFVRSVYGGAATRVAEIVQRTRQAMDDGADDADDEASDSDVDDDEDAEFDDDELDEDDEDEVAR